MKRIVPIITVTAIILCLAKSIQVKANDITNNYDILALQPGIELTSIIDAYERLTTQQQLIAEYLVGSFNNIYLCARGFSYDIPYDQSNLQAQFSAMGSKVFDFITTRIGWKSRVNEVFRQYLSSVIVYASSISVSFSAWFAGQISGEDRQIFIPYSEDAFDAWTTFYNDPSGGGIASFGAVEAPFVSGQFYDYAFDGVPFRDYTDRNAYNNFVLNHSPLIYTNFPNIAGAWNSQYVFNPYMYVRNNSSVKYLIDSLYVKRDLSNACFGNTNNILTENMYCDFLSLGVWPQGELNGNSKIQISQNGNAVMRGIISNNGMNLKNFINYCFDLTPFSHAGSAYHGFYYIVEHVYLVDNLSNFSNKEEILNVEDLSIVAPVNDGYILAPNDRMILPSFPGVPDDPLGFWDIIVDNSLDINGDNVSDDDYHTSIVNNNVINNYYVSDDVKINVPVDWFENPYTDQLYEDSSNFIDFAKDCIDCLGDFDIYMYGAIVVGLAGGIVKKLLL